MTPALNMDSNMIFAKSARGQEAMQQRTPDLSQEERRVLIMADGKRSVAELLRLITSSIDVPRHLERLLSAGYIVPQGGAPGAVVAEPVGSPRPTAPVAAQATVQPSWAMRDTIKDVLKQELTEFMGPLAPLICDEVCPRVSTLEEALTALAAELGDPAKGERFRQNVLRRLQ